MRTLGLIAFCVTAILGTAANTRAQQSQTTTSSEAGGTITGRVTINNEGAPGIVIALQPAPEPLRLPLADPVSQVTTDKEGRFQLTNVAAGRYYLIPLTPDYIAPPSEDGMAPSSKSVMLMKGEKIEGVELALKSGGVITGRVRTADDLPAAGRDIYIYLVDGRDQLRTLAINRGNSSHFKTDDRGIYRINNLPAGHYLVSAMGDDSIQPRGWAFHPGVTERSQAKVIEIKEGQEVENIDIKLPPKSRTYEVSGCVVDEATGQPIPWIRVDWSTMEISGNSGGYYRGGPPVNDRGEFRFTGLLPGRYAAFVPIDSGSEYTSDQAVFEIGDQDVAGVEIRARHAASLSGTVVIEGTRDPAVLTDLSHLRLVVFRLEGGHGTGVQVDADGRFRVSGLPPDKFQIQLSSRTQPQRFSFLGIERNNVWQPNQIEVTAGEQVTGLRLRVGYGTGTVHGQVQIVGGALPENARLSVTTRRTDIAGWPSSVQVWGPVRRVDALRRFLIEGLSTGEHEIRLTVFVPPQPGTSEQSPRWQPVKQTIKVTSGAESQVTLVLDASASIWAQPRK